MPTFTARLALVLCLAGASLNAAPVQFQGRSFDAQVIRSSGQPYREFRQGGKATLKVRPDEEYSIVIRNPLPVRVGVAVSVDGLNSIDGKRSSPGKARKWIIEPHGSLTVQGWQTGGDSLRKFVFTQPDAAYANWREKKEGKPYAKNMGVIGVAWFWNRAELEAVLNPPKPFEDDEPYSKSARSESSPAPAAAGSRAGTGMGREQRNSVVSVEFNGDAGMFAVKDVLKLYYEFAEEPLEPQPFVSDEDDRQRFSPEMPK